MKFLKAIVPVIAIFVVLQAPWFIITDFEGDTLSLTLNGSGEGAIWVPEGMEEFSGFPFGWVIVGFLVIGAAGVTMDGIISDDSNDAPFGTGILVFVSALVTLFARNWILGAAPEDLHLPEGDVTISLGAAFWITLVAAVAMVGLGFLPSGGSADRSTEDNQDSSSEESPDNSPNATPTSPTNGQNRIQNPFA